MKFKLIKKENNNDKTICWDIWELEWNPSIKILSFGNGKYTLEHTQKSGKVIDCGRFDSLTRAKMKALSLNEYLGY
ncbi:MAG: hypothetical protein Unbinned2990contig1001_55 [Prokaryotic dsDNA virus sp.]|nr:MAG: hypothetical protein Unbinned2990contig1001_55 [Prokaryotic dsDNA virus sp.]